MATIGSLVVNLIANTAGFSAGLKKGERDAKAFESRMKTSAAAVNALVGSMAAGFGVAGGAFAFVSFLKSSYAEASEAEKVMAQLNAVIKSTGGAAGLSAYEISEFAAELQKTTTFADDTTKAAAGVLATFTNIKGDVFKGALVAAQDLNTALGGDLQSNIIQIGKALNDPVKGITALTRVGVSFTDQQKAEIKTLVEKNKVMKAQLIILKELNAEFGGSAVAAANTTPGRASQLANEWADFKEDFGKGAAPAVVDPAVSGASGLLNLYRRYINELNDPERYIPGKADMLNGIVEYGKFSGRGAGWESTPLGPDVREAAKQYNLLMKSGVIGKGNPGRLRPNPIGSLGMQGFEMGLAGAMKRTFTKNTGLSGLLDTAFGSQFIGKNRENLRGVNRAQFDAWSAARNPMAQNFRPEYRPLAALERGSAEAYSAIQSSKASPFTALNDTAKKQLVAQQQTAINTGKMATPNVIAMGN